MTQGDLDLYPEYTGTAYTAILGRKPISDPAAVRSDVSREYAARWDLIWSAPPGIPTIRLPCSGLGWRAT